MIFNPSAAGKNSLNAEAGLLTCSVRAPSQFPNGLLPEHISLKDKNLQQQVLFRILTEFPFHLDASLHKDTFYTTKVCFFSLRCSA